MEIYVYNIGDSLVEFNSKPSADLESTNGMKYNEEETLRRREIYNRVEHLYDYVYDEYYSSDNADESVKKGIMSNVYSQLMEHIHHT